MLTTDEMDGLYTEQDKANRDKFYLQCFTCSEWTLSGKGREDISCSNCGSNAFDLTSATSIRTFDPVRAKKRKVRKK